MILAFVAALATGGTVSVETPGIQLELLLRDLTAQCGQSLECAAPLASEVLAVSFRNQAIETVRKQLGAVLNANWEEREGRWTIRQTDEQKKIDLDIHREQKRAIFQRFVDSTKAYRPQREWNATDAAEFAAIMQSRYEGGYHYLPGDSKRRISIAEVNQRTPTSRLLANLASIMKPEFFHLDRIEKNESTFYSNDDVPDDERVPVDYRPFLEQFAREQTALYDATREKTILRMPLKLEISGWPLFVRVYDRDWKQITTGPMYVSDDAKLVPEPEQFAHSEDFKKAEAVVNYYQPFRSPNIEPYWNILRNADKQDPLGIYIGRSWLDFATTAKKPLIASIGEIENDFKLNADIPKVQQEGFKVGSCRIDQDGWILGRPTDPLENRVFRADRKKVKRYAQLVIPTLKTTPTLREETEIADLSIRIFRPSKGVPHGRMIPGRYQGLLMMIYASMAGENGYVERSFQLPGSSFSNDSASVLRWLRNSGGLASLTLSPSNFTIYNQRYLFPDRELAKAVFKSQVSQEDVYVASFGPDSTSWSPVDCAEAYRSRLSNPHSYQGLSLQIGVRAVLNLSITLNGRSITEKAYGRAESLSQSFTFEKIPDAIKRKLEAIQNSGGN